MYNEHISKIYYFLYIECRNRFFQVLELRLCHLDRMGEIFAIIQSKISPSGRDDTRARFSCRDKTNSGYYTIRYTIHICLPIASFLHQDFMRIKFNPGKRAVNNQIHFSRVQVIICMIQSCLFMHFPFFISVHHCIPIK